ncbi:sarcosine oxidase subunit alpha family protein [Rhodospirillaceae bacterium KN72]|uniref:Sarcosine oxidase subunit alpha family protein n=1 Tax=Pacificispira spongiicola TaxID=2729598 RepID=A0A7Y0E161_9PROT|nr:sarcosine oxidase subunit alpha family protein [Pacificispira spongiicola]NMM45343.1 sarcosine oxidase subunit alpha family protein [Pacificispira spongiicola]
MSRIDGFGRIDRSKPLSFTFDGKTYQGFEGDTLASALLANGVSLVGRSFKYHRPRGVFSAGPEEPNALVALRSGARREPNTRATMVELYDGLVAESQNRWPSLAFDVQAVNQVFARFLPAGFYYKTFMGPFANTRLWMMFEHVIRRAAGMGSATYETDPDTYARRSVHCDVLVVGGGPSGLSAALAASETGARVILIDEHAEFGGRLRQDRYDIDGMPAADWVAKSLATLASRDTVRLLSRTSAFGYYDNNMIGCVERVTDHLAVPVDHKPRQRWWQIRAAQVVLATGALEQPLVFGNNDRPGVMLAGAVRAYLNQFGVLPGKRAVIFTSGDDAYRTALDLTAAGAQVMAVVDSRDTAQSALTQAVRDAGIEVLTGHAVVDTHGSPTLQRVDVMPLTGGTVREFTCDLLAMSGGWQPSVHLSSQTGAKPVWNAELSCFLPGVPKRPERSAGSAAGHFTLYGCLSEGSVRGLEAAKAAGFSATGTFAIPQVDIERFAPTAPLWEAPDPPPGLFGGHPKKFVDHQDDVAASDIQLAHREGYISVEHLKRYTTLGMGTDQGKTSNLTGLAIMAALRGEPIEKVGTTTFRPPYTPISIGAMGGSERGQQYKPRRRSPMHDWHDARVGEWVPAGLWDRPRHYPATPGESMRDAYIRETRQTRGSVGICDVTTLGKIDLQGPDALDFINRIYANGFSNLPVGKVRYGLMLREDGMVLDDGTVARLGETHYVITTTTANAVPVMAKIEFLLQAVWPELKVKATSVTEQYAAIAVAGPKAREVMQRVVDLDVSNAAFPFMACAPCRTKDGVPGRLFRISFSGELAYEIAVPSDYGQQVWDALMAAGREFDIVPYGLEALGNMRIEKGHVAGSELDGRTTADDLGLGKMLSKKKDFIGKALAFRPGMTGETRKKLVGLVPVDGRSSLPNGSQIVSVDHTDPPVKMLGHVTANGFSPERNIPVALALLEGGLAREGETVLVTHPLKNIAVQARVTGPVFVDPEGKRLHD